MSTSKGLIWQRKYKVLSLPKIQKKTVGTQCILEPKCRYLTSEWDRMRSAASMGAITHAGGFNLSCLVYYLTAFHLSFLPSVPLHVWLSIPETPAALPRFRSRQECRGGCTGQWIRWRAAEYRNCSRVSFCGPSLLFSLRFNMNFFKVRLCKRYVAAGMAPSMLNRKCRHLSSRSHLRVCICYSVML